MVAEPVEPSSTVTALANEWQQLLRAAREPGICGADSQALIERADAALDRLAATPTNTDAVRVAELLRPTVRLGTDCVAQRTLAS